MDSARSAKFAEEPRAMPLDEKCGERYLLAALQFESLLRKVLFRMTRNHADVEELLQETYARLLVAGSSETLEVKSIRAFSITTARNLAIDFLRHRLIVPIELVPDLADLELTDEHAALDDIIGRRQEIEQILSAMQGFPERARRVFILHKVYGFTRAQIAKRTYSSESIVKEDLSLANIHLAPTLFSPSNPSPDGQPRPTQATKK